MECPHICLECQRKNKEHDITEVAKAQAWKFNKASAMVSGFVLEKLKNELTDTMKSYIENDLDEWTGLSLLNMDNDLAIAQLNHLIK